MTAGRRSPAGEGGDIGSMASLFLWLLLLLLLTGMGISQDQNTCNGFDGDDYNMEILTDTCDGGVWGLIGSNYYNYCEYVDYSNLSYPEPYNPYVFYIWSCQCATVAYEDYPYSTNPTYTPILGKNGKPTYYLCFEEDGCYGLGGFSVEGACAQCKGGSFLGELFEVDDCTPSKYGGECLTVTNGITSTTYSMNYVWSANYSLQNPNVTYFVPALLTPSPCIECPGKVVIRMAYVFMFAPPLLVIITS